MTHKNTNRRDANEAEIVEYWRKAGCLWIPMQYPEYRKYLPSQYHIITNLEEAARLIGKE